jgi:centriolar protein POC1
MISVEKIAELSGHNNPVFTLELSQKPGILFTGGNDKGLVEWDLKDNSFIKVMFPVRASVYAIHGPVNYPLLFTGLRSGEVMVFDFIKQQLSPSLKHHLKPIFDIKSLKTKSELVVASEDGTVSIWNLDNLTFLHSIKVSADTVRAIAISPDEKQVAFGCRDNMIRVYDAEDYTLVKVIPGHSMAVFTLAYSPEGNYLISGSRDAQVKVWDSITYNEVKNIQAHLFAVNHIAFHPTEPYFATASMDKSIKIWGSDDFKLYKNISREKGYPIHRLSINKLAWFDGGKKLLSVSDDKLVMVWQVAL